MAVSNKKKKAILRSYPGKSVPELANELGVSKREVKAVLRSEGRLPAPSLKIPLAMAGAAMAITLLVLGTYSLYFGPGPDQLARLSGELNVLMVTIDTLLADRLCWYGYCGARTPVIDSVAASGVRFDNAYCHQPLTLPSHATLLTGTHPAHHGIAHNGLFVLPEEAETMAETLKGAGFSTGAVIASFALHRQFGLDQGFDSYDDTLSAERKQDAGGFEEMRATAVSNRALEWLGQNAAERWFLWIHYYDPHSAYEPPPEHQWTGGHPYDGEVAYVDFELGRVMDDLEKRGLRERTLVVIAADHGESMGDHGELTHGLFLYGESMRAPLIVSLPDAIPAGRVASQTVSLMDVAPTMFSALGLTPPKQVQGRSLLPLLFSDPADWVEVPVTMETMAPWHEHGWSPSSAVVAESFKFIAAPKPELYDLEADPRELENLYDKNHSRAELMEKRLKALRSRYSESSLEGKSSVKMDDRTRDRLASLGYIFSGPASGSPAGNEPDVKDKIGLMKTIEQASDLFDSGNEDEAISLLEDVLEQSPDSRKLLNRLGTWCAQKNDLQNAEKYFKRLLQLDPEYIAVYENLGLLYANSARLEEATLMAQTALSKLPRSAKALGLMGIIRLLEKDYRGALEVLDKAIAYYPSSDKALANRSVAHYYLGEYEKALEDLKKARQIMPENERYAQLVDQLEKQIKATKAR
jgi:arylsulfatase A-like enzyme/Flp pilus assembly protein TadD